MKVEIPDEIVEKLKKRVDSTDEFDSIEKYVNYILKQVTERLENEKQEKDEEPVFSEEDEEKVKDRLRSLGYLD